MNAPLHTNPETEAFAPGMSDEVALREIPFLAAAIPLSQDGLLY
jgi:hypothetical protein